MTTDTIPLLPRTVEDVTVDWLTQVLRADGTLAPDATVTEVDHQQIAVGTGFLSKLYRLRLGVSGGDERCVIVKLPADPGPYRQLGEMSGAYVRELAYYRDLADAAPLRAPRAHFAAQADDSTDFALVMEDFGNLDSPDHLAGLPPADAERVIDMIARLHAWSLTDGAAVVAASPVPGVDNPGVQIVCSVAFPDGWSTYEANARQPIPENVAAFARRYQALFPSLMAELAHPAALAHGDLRVDNLFFDHTRSPAVVDFQLAMRATGVWDFAYLVSQGLRTEHRTRQDERLLTRYWQTLTTAGVDGYSFEDAWRQYRIATLVQLAYPLAAMTGWDGLPDRAHDLCLTLVERAIATIQETHALAEIGGRV